MTLKLAESVPGPTLKECEAVIERSLRTFVVGEALREIRDSQLYTPHYASFDDYCQKRWSFPHRQAERLIAAAEVAQLVRDHGTLTLPNGTVAHELVPLLADPDRLIATWIALSTFDTVPSVAQVREVVQRVKAAPPDTLVEKVVKDAIAERSSPARNGGGGYAPKRGWRRARGRAPGLRVVAVFTERGCELHATRSRSVLEARVARPGS